MGAGVGDFTGLGVELFFFDNFGLFLKEYY